MGNIVHQMMGGLRSSMGYTGSAAIEDLRQNAKFVKLLQQVCLNHMFMT
jgi:IMP dehydrogenase